MCVCVCVCVCLIHMHVGGNIFWDSDYTPDDGDVNKQYYTLLVQLFIKSCVGNVSYCLSLQLKQQDAKHQNAGDVGGLQKTDFFQVL